MRLAKVTSLEHANAEGKRPELQELMSRLISGVAKALRSNYRRLLQSHRRRASAKCFLTPGSGAAYRFRDQSPDHLSILGTCFAVPSPVAFDAPVARAPNRFASQPDRRSGPASNTELNDDFGNPDFDYHHRAGSYEAGNSFAGAGDVQRRGPLRPSGPRAGTTSRPSSVQTSARKPLKPSAIRALAIHPANAGHLQICEAELPRMAGPSSKRCKT